MPQPLPRSSHVFDHLVGGCGRSGPKRVRRRNVADADGFGVRLWCWAPPPPALPPLGQPYASPDATSAPPSAQPYYPPAGAVYAPPSGKPYYPPAGTASAPPAGQPYYPPPGATSVPPSGQPYYPPPSYPPPGQPYPYPAVVAPPPGPVVVRVAPAPPLASYQWSVSLEGLWLERNVGSGVRLGDTAYTGYAPSPGRCTFRPRIACTAMTSPFRWQRGCDSR